MGWAMGGRQDLDGNEGSMTVLESGELKGRKIGSTWRVPRAAITSYMWGQFLKDYKPVDW